MTPKSIAIVVPNVLGEGVTGPAMRCLEMARILVLSFRVTLLANRSPAFSIPDGVETELYTSQDIGARLSKFHIVISQGLDYRARYIATLSNIQIFDLYDPVLFELEAGNRLAPTVSVEHLDYLRCLTGLLIKRGSFFVCATPQQRDLWLGALYLAGRLQQRLDRQYLQANEIIGVVPFGHDDLPPQKTSQVIKGVIPGISREDRVVIWNGGIWNWFDTEVLLRAMRILQASRPEIKLLFMGVKHPHESFKGDQLARHTQRRSADMGLTGENVFFKQAWVPYDQRGNLLLEADLAVCTAPSGLENHFSFRTRLVDALWAKLPYVCTEGNFFAELAVSQGVGLVVSPGDAEGLAAQIQAALETKTMEHIKSNLERTWADFCWEKCLAPLVDYCNGVDVSTTETERQTWKSWYGYLSYIYSTKVEKHLKAYS